MAKIELEGAGGGGGGSFSGDAADVTFAPAGSVASTDVQAAIEEVSGDADAAGSGLAAHLADATDAHDASAISVADSGGNYTGTDVEAVLAEIAASLGGGAAGGTMQLKVIADAATLNTGDGQLQFCIPPALNGLNLTDAQAYVTTVSSSGTPTIQLRNVTDSVDMLTTKITIDASEKTSYTAATPSVIDTAHDDVATGDIIAVDVDVAGTGAKGLGLLLTFA